MVHPASRRSIAFRRWTARWYGPVFTLLGLIWLVTTPFTTGSRNVIALRVILGIMFVIVGIASTVTSTNSVRRLNANQRRRGLVAASFMSLALLEGRS